MTLSNLTQVLRRGEENLPNRSFPKNLSSFLKKITISHTDCWEWTAGLDKSGYGRLKVNGKTLLSHRFIYEYYHGQICPDLVIDHLCKNRKCVNPEHLEQVTTYENNRRSKDCKENHCIHDHEFTPQNTYMTPAGKRQCRKCNVVRSTKYRNNSLFEVL